MTLMWTVHAIALALYAIPMLFFPTAFWDLFDVTLNEGTVVIVQAFGGVILANSVLSWLVRYSADSDIRQAILFHFFISWAITVVVALIGQINDAMNALGWITVVLGLFWSVVFGYLRFVYQESAPSRQ